MKMFLVYFTKELRWILWNRTTVFFYIYIYIFINLNENEWGLTLSSIIFYENNDNFHIWLNSLLSIAVVNSLSL